MSGITALGIVTYNRPDILSCVLEGVLRNLDFVLDSVFIYDDASDAPGYPQVFDRYPGFAAESGANNLGVAHAKNALLHRMLDAGADWLFLSEDDVLATDPHAITGYIEASKQSGLEHLSFHHDQCSPLFGNGSVTCWPNHAGAWTFYTRRCIEDVGFFDESFVNAFEHIEHTTRCALAGYTSAPDERGYCVADATGSENWIYEIPVPSVRASRKGWSYELQRGKRHWREAHPDTYRLVFG